MGCPSILTIEPKDEIFLEDVGQEQGPTEQEGEVQFDYDKLLRDSQKWSLIDIGQIDFSQKIVHVVYNPSSGKQVDIRKLIAEKF